VLGECGVGKGAGRGGEGMEGVWRGEAGGRGGEELQKACGEGRAEAVRERGVLIAGERPEGEGRSKRGKAGGAHVRKHSPFCERYVRCIRSVLLEGAGELCGLVRW
jgi:hypothetical protein